MNQILEQKAFDSKSIKLVASQIPKDPLSIQAQVDDSGYVTSLQAHLTSEFEKDPVENGILLKNFLALSSNLITGNPELQKKYCQEVMRTQEFVFDLCWSEYEDLDTTQIGECCLKNLVVFLHNCCVGNKVFLGDNALFIYKVHRYIYISQEDEDQSEELQEVQEWYSRLILSLLKSSQEFSKVYGNFYSKKDKQNFEMQNHSSGITFLKAGDSLLISKDQMLLLSFVKNLIEQMLKENSKLDCQTLLSEEMAKDLASQYLSTYVDVFNAYYTDQKVIRAIYFDKKQPETHLLDFLEIIKSTLDILIQVTAFGSSADHYKTLLSDYEDCLIFQKSGELIMKLKGVADYLIELEIYKPVERFKENVGIESQGESIMKVHPFAGFLATIMCMNSNLSYFKSANVEAYFNSDKGWAHLGQVLANTKLDIDNPSLREWCYVIIRNLTSWSEPIRQKLQNLTLIDAKNPHDSESLKNLQALGKPMQEMYEKEREKFKKDEEDQRKLMEAMMKAANVDVVDF